MTNATPRPINLPLLLGAIGLLILFALGGLAAGTFVLLYSPDPAEGQMEFTLPAVGEVQTRADGKANPDRPQEIKPVITVVLRGIRDGADKGNLQEIVVRWPQGQTTVRNVEDLAACLEARRPALGNQTDIQIAAESTVKYSFVIGAMDACVKAGFTHVGFAPPPDLRSN